MSTPKVNPTGRVSIDLHDVKSTLEKMARKAKISPTKLGRFLIISGLKDLASGSKTIKHGGVE